MQRTRSDETARVKIALLDPMSYFNLGLYDASLTSSLLGAGEDSVILIGNENFEFQRETEAEFIGCFRYSGRGFLMKFFQYFRSMLEVSRIIRSRSIDVIHVQWSKLPLVDCFFYKAFRRKGVQLVFTMHNAVPRRLDRRSIEENKRLCGHFDHIIVHDEYSRAKVHELYGIETGKVTVVPHGPLKFPTLIETESKREGSVIQEVPKNKYIVAFLGYLKKYKGIDIFIDSVASSDEIPGLHYLIAGYGKVPELMKLEQRNDVTILNRKLENDEFLALMRATNLLVLPYREISQSGLLMTALAEGVPALASNCGGMAEILKKSGCGRIMRELSVDEIRRCIEEEFHRGKGTPRECSLPEEYRWSRIGERTLQVYNSLALGQGLN